MHYFTKIFYVGKFFKALFCLLGKHTFKQVKRDEQHKITYKRCVKCGVRIATKDEDCVASQDIQYLWITHGLWEDEL